MENKEQKFKCEKCHHIFKDSEKIVKTKNGSNCCDNDKTYHCPKCNSQYFKWL